MRALWSGRQNCSDDVSQKRRFCDFFLQNQKVSAGFPRSLFFLFFVNVLLGFSAVETEQAKRQQRFCGGKGLGRPKRQYLKKFPCFEHTSGYKVVKPEGNFTKLIWG